MCQEAIVIQGEVRKFVSGCGDLCRVLGIDLVDLPAMDYSKEGVESTITDGDFQAEACLCHIDFDRLALDVGMTIRREPMEVILTAPPASDAKYRKWLQSHKRP